MEIKMANLTKIFISKDKKEVHAVDHVDLVIPSGKLIGLLGPSGCGKSTTLYLIAGLLRQTEGEIYFGEEEMSETPPEKRGIGLVFQNYALYPHMTVRENILFPLENLKVEKEEAKKRTFEMAKLVGLEEMLDRKPKELSGGQQQRVAIARALVKTPRVLLLDEPLSNLDARLRLQTREEIKRIQRETKITTVFVTHDQEEAMSISDEIVVMKDGIIQQMGEPQEVYDKPTNLFVAKFLGNPQINVFDGEIKNKEILIENMFVGKRDLPDQKVFIGVRPEGFIIDQENKSSFHFKVDLVETIGRDTTLIFDMQDDSINILDKKTFKAIIDAGFRIKAGDVVHFNIKPEKMHLFDINGTIL
ncbi:MAG: ABC transporter ATP-binding protein [Candidatus Izemoplasmatales bacterium]|nr:ABC transporter ATP-binding protein [Candidatus Izemoplasmatales bacterium]MDD3865531.1 ABC transporter ATP-binding protein [Candidatus Izemoplasmatales bacterium]